MEDKNVVLVQEFLRSLRIGEGQHSGGLSVFTLHSEIKSSYDYATLEEAVREGLLKITEVGSGTVPEIAVINNGKKDVFIMDGEELVGAKQNRIVNISLIVPAETEIKIPVSCVERGRWRHTTFEFLTSSNISYANLRLKQKMSVVESALKSSTFRADQGEVWDEISEKMSKHKIASQTEAMSDIYEKEKNRIEDYKEKFKHVDGQIGAVFALEGKIFGMDVFDKEDTCRKFLPRIIRSYALEVIDMPMKKTRVKKIDVNDIEKFLKTLTEAEFLSKKSPGAGMTVTLTGKNFAGTSLVAKDTVVHTSVFTMPEKEKKPRDYETDRIRRPSKRRYIIEF